MNTFVESIGKPDFNYEKHRNSNFSTSNYIHTNPEVISSIKKDIKTEIPKQCKK